MPRETLKIAIGFYRDAYFWLWSLSRPRHPIGTVVRNRYVENNRSDAVLHEYMGASWHPGPHGSSIIQEEWWAKSLNPDEKFPRISVSVGYFWRPI